MLEHSAFFLTWERICPLYGATHAVPAATEVAVIMWDLQRTAAADPLQA